MRLREKLAILCAKSISMLIRGLTRRDGSTIPGYAAGLIDPNILPFMAKKVRCGIIAVMGTNGKTTTTGILCHVLRSEGKKVLTNRTGANMLNGVISAFVLAADRKGELDIDYACIEVDEFASVQILPLLQPGCVLLTNIFRDQIDRYGEIDTICDRIRTALSEVSEEVLIVNGDDFLSWTLAGKCGRRLVTYGINEKMFDHSSNPKIRESTFCHFCGEKLEYDFFHYGQLGIYRCPGCGWKRPLPDYTAEEVRFEKGRYRFRIGGIPIQSQASGPYNVYNTLSAYAGLKALGAPVHGFRRAVEIFDYGNSREGSFQINGAQVILYLAKNPVGFQQKISMMLKDRKPKDIIIQINDGSQDGKDISWLWDVDFQYFAHAGAASVTAVGNRCLDMVLRLKYEDISCETEKNLRTAVEKRTEEGTGNIYIILNYSGLLSANRMLRRLQRISDRETGSRQKRGGEATP